MAKIAFSKLKCSIDNSVKIINFNQETIEIKKYLSITDKLKLMGNVIIKAHEEDENYSNPIKVKIFTELEMVEAYTNISFSDSQKKNIAKTYDCLVSSGLLQLILDNIEKDEYNLIVNGIEKSIKSVYEYYNGIFGVLDSIKNGYNVINSEEDLNTLQLALTEIKESTLMKEILPLIGQDS